MAESNNALPPAPDVIPPPLAVLLQRRLASYVGNDSQAHHIDIGCGNPDKLQQAIGQVVDGYVQTLRKHFQVQQPVTVEFRPIIDVHEENARLSTPPKPLVDTDPTIELPKK